MAEMKFLKAFNTTIKKMPGVSGAAEPPRYWYHTGNYSLNKIISGSFKKGIPQGRITTIAGPSAAGKSFVAGNIVREAQKEGAFCLIIDSENAMDDAFMEAIGVDTVNNYQYIGVDTISQAQQSVGAFLKGYRKEYGEDPNAPQILICIDSLTMLTSDAEATNYDAGKTVVDMGARNKALKAMLRAFVHDIKRMNVALINTIQVYKNQEMFSAEGKWVIPDAIKYSASQIILCTRTKLRDGEKNIDGIKLRCEGYKTRFTAPFQAVVIEVPYSTGMNPFSGLEKAAYELGAIKKLPKPNSNKFVIHGDEENMLLNDNMDDYNEEILEKCEELRTHFLEGINLEKEDDELNKEVETITKKRQVKAKTKRTPSND